MESRLTIAGHPLHPMLVLFPVGLLTWAFVAFLVYAVNGSITWYQIGFWTTWAGIVAANPAAAAGFGDYVTVARHHAFQLATAHMVMNLSVVALFVVSGFISMDEGALAGVDLASVLILQGIGVATLGVSGWIGQEMAHRRGLAARESAGELPGHHAEPGQPLPQQRPAAGRR